MEKLSIVLKTVERCNINCKYCYFFNKEDQSYKEHPPIIDKNTLNKLVDFLKEGCHDLNLKKIVIGFHGGEPLIQKKEDFSEMCRFFISELSPYVDISFNVQTNGILINEKWIKLLSEYNVGIGISIDGPKEYHDKERIDFYERGTYHLVEKSIKLLSSHPLIKNNISTITVVNPENDAKKIYRHFVDNLELKSFDFSLPYFTHDNMPPFSPEQYGIFMRDILDEWIKDDNPNIKVRFLVSAFRVLFGGSGLVYGHGPVKTNNNLPLMTVRSDGSLEPTTELMSTDPSSVSQTNLTIYNTSLKEFSEHSIFKEIKSAQTIHPDLCQNCCWENICGSGAIVHRFSKSKRFNNPSIYCEGLKLFYSRLMAYVLKWGADYPLDNIYKNLFTPQNVL